MGRRRFFKNEINKGTWSKEEDEVLFNFVTLHGEGNWPEVAKCSGLKRCAKSCRYRYLNYLKPDIKRGDISEQEQILIIKLHQQFGNRWSLIAKNLPGRTDIEIKNYWKIYLSKKLHHEGKTTEKKTKILRKKDEEVDRHGLKGAWSKKEDEILFNFVALHGEGQWEMVAQKTGLKRCGSSCRHRYLHYLKPGIKRGNISKEEEDIITRLHQVHGNRWTLIAKMLPGRTDSEIKNYWHAYLSKKLETSPESSLSLKKYKHELEDNNSEQINNYVYSSPEVPSSTTSTTNTENLENNIIWPFSSTSDYNTNNPILSPNSFQIEYDHDFLDDFLLDIFQNNDQIEDGLNSKIPQIIEDNNMVRSSSSSSIDHQCQPSEEDLDFWISSTGFPLFEW